MSTPLTATSNLLQELVIREYVPGESVAPITRLLHAAYAGLAAAGFRYLATHQDDATTQRRLDSGVAFIAERGGEPVGMISLRTWDADSSAAWYRQPGVYIFGQFGVLPDCQGRGVGHRLYRVVEDRAVSDGAEELALDTAEGATHLRNWCARLGYRFIEYTTWAEVNYRSVILSKRLVR